METPSILPCKCLNPHCGIVFYARNPFQLQGRNIKVQNIGTKCPKCNQGAQYADWSIDSSGNFQLRDFFNFIREFDDVAKLTKLKNNLDQTNNLSATELADTLERIDPKFSRFRDVINSIPKESIKYLIQIILTIVALGYSHQTWLSSNKNHKEAIELQKEVLKFDQTKFEYQRNQDSLKAEREKVLANKIEALEQKFEERILNMQSQGVGRNLPSKRKMLKSSDRNKPCPCGSGIKAKKCHPNGLM